MASACDEPLARYLTRENGTRIAYRHSRGRSPSVVFLGGFSSDMTGTKATHLDAYCRARGQGFLRLDYQGHGASSGSFVDGTIGMWRDDALAVIEHCIEGPLVLVGSSMGAWIMALGAAVLSRRLAGLVGIASAPDFTEDLIWQRLSPEQRAAIEHDGVIHLPSEYTEGGAPITLRLIENGRKHRVLDGRIRVDCRVRLLHGLDDRDVPWSQSLRLLEVLDAPDATLELVKGGDHRLSKPADLARISRTLDTLLGAGE